MNSTPIEHQPQAEDEPAAEHPHAEYSHEDITAEFGYCIDCQNPLEAYETEICLDCEAKRNAEFGNSDFL